MVSASGSSISLNFQTPLPDATHIVPFPAFQHPDPDLTHDPLSTNRRLHETADLAMFGTLVVAGPTPV